MGVSGEHRSVRGSWIVTGLTCGYSRLLLRDIFHAFINLPPVSSCIQFDFTPPPQHSYPHVQTSTRLSLSIYKWIRLYSDVYVRKKVEENRNLTRSKGQPRNGRCRLGVVNSRIFISEEN